MLIPQAGADRNPRGQLQRTDKILTAGEIDALLGSAFCGRTATLGADGYPYVVPNLFVWASGSVYLHTGRHPGHFRANVRHCDKVSFEVDEPGEVFPYGHVQCDTSVSFRSVVIFGSIRTVEDDAEKLGFFRAFMAKYAPPDSWGREADSFPRLAATTVYAIAPVTVTGKGGVLPGIADRWPSRNDTLSPNWRPTSGGQG